MSDARLDAVTMPLLHRIRRESLMFHHPSGAAPFVTKDWAASRKKSRSFGGAGAIRWCRRLQAREKVDDSVARAPW
jgi:hypothetical protein